MSLKFVCVSISKRGITARFETKYTNVVITCKRTMCAFNRPNLNVYTRVMPAVHVTIPVSVMGIPADSGTGATAGKIAGTTCCRFYWDKTHVGKSPHACAQFTTRG